MSFYDEVIPQILLLSTVVVVCIAHLFEQKALKKAEEKRKIQQQHAKKIANAKRKHLERYGLENHV